LRNGSDFATGEFLRSLSHSLTLGFNEATSSRDREGGWKPLAACSTAMRVKLFFGGATELERDESRRGAAREHANLLIVCRKVALLEE